MRYLLFPTSDKGSARSKLMMGQAKRCIDWSSDSFSARINAGPSRRSKRKSLRSAISAVCSSNERRTFYKVACNAFGSPKCFLQA